MSGIRRALILAAGRGTRLGALTANCPKPMLDLGGRPILERLVTALRDGAGIREFVIVTGYLAGQIESHFGDGSRLSVAMSYVRQVRQDGTGSGVHLARELLQDAPFLLTWGDIVVSASNYGGIADAFARTPCDVLLGLNWVDDPASGAAVYLDEHSRVVRLVEKPAPGTSTTHWNNAGLMVLRPKIFEYTALLKPSARGEYELPHAITTWLADGCHALGYPLEGLWSDIGTPDDLEKTREAVTR